MIKAEKTHESETPARRYCEDHFVHPSPQNLVANILTRKARSIRIITIQQHVCCLCDSLTIFLSYREDTEQVKSHGVPDHSHNLGLGPVDLLSKGVK